MVCVCAVGLFEAKVRCLQVSPSLPEINIAVVGAPCVGKTTFIGKALSLPPPAESQAAERKVPLDGHEYLVRLLEVPIDDVEVDEDDEVSWPDAISDKMMPRVDGTKYDISSPNVWDTC
jgi:hypothetical protein